MQENTFQATNRINGFIYIKDWNGKYVSINGKPKRFKTTYKAADFIVKLEQVMKMGDKV